MLTHTHTYEHSHTHTYTYTHAHILFSVFEPLSNQKKILLKIKSWSLAEMALTWIALKR